MSTFDRIQAFALALGGPGLFIVAFLDASFLSLPEINDLLLIWMVTQHKSRVLYYASCVTIGSIAGCLVLYFIGRQSENWLAKRLSAERVTRAMVTLRKYGVMAVLIPALLPPPAPFKIFVILAGVSGISPARFIAAIAIGRGIRYFGEGFLAVWYGDRALELIRVNGQIIGLAVLAACVVAGIGYLVLKRVSRGKGL